MSRVMGKNLESIPLKHRHVVAISPGFLFADEHEMKWPGKSWEDDEALAKELIDRDDDYVAFRRYIYDPEEGKKYLDDGWVYFGGKVYDGKDVLDGKTDVKVGDIGRRNIEYNNLKRVIWFEEFADEMRRQVFLLLGEGNHKEEE